MNEQPEEPLIEAAIDRALERYGDAIPASNLPTLRSALRCVLSTHPDAQEILRRLRPVGDVQESGELTRGEAAQIAKAVGGK